MKNRMIFKTAAAAAMALAFSGCTAITGDMGGERAWRTYMENDTSIQQIGFITETTVYEMSGGKKEEKFGDYMGRAEVKSPGESDSASQNLGWVYSSGDGVKTLIVIDLDSGRNVDLSDKDEIKKLQNSKKFKFYEFGGGILESVVYSVQKSPVCKAFFSGEPINARSVTNYYVGASDEFFATVIDAKIVGNKGFEIKNLDFKFNLPSSKLTEAKEQATSAKFRQDIIEQDLKKQGHILLNILCYYRMPDK